jgi:hypothetical protein
VPMNAGRNRGRVFLISIETEGKKRYTTCTSVKAREALHGHEFGCKTNLQSS